MRTLVSRAVAGARATSSGLTVTDFPADTLDRGFRQDFDGLDRDGHPERASLDDPDFLGSRLDFDAAVPDGDLESHTRRNPRLIPDRGWQDEAPGIVHGGSGGFSHTSDST